MTTPKPERKRVKIEPEPGGRLEQLLIMHKRFHDEAEAADEAEAEYKAGIKAWLLSLYPDAADVPDAFDIPADANGRYPAYSMSLRGVGSYRLNGSALKDASPETWVQYAVPVTPAWELRESTQGRSQRRG